MKAVDRVPVRLCGRAAKAGGAGLGRGRGESGHGDPGDEGSSRSWGTIRSVLAAGRGGSVARACPRLPQPRISG